MLKSDTLFFPPDEWPWDSENWWSYHTVFPPKHTDVRWFVLPDPCWNAKHSNVGSNKVFPRSWCIRASPNTNTKINLLNKVLGIVAGVLLQDHDTRHAEFQQLPYHRIFIMLFLELNTPEPILEAINYQVLTAFCHTLHILRPAKAPGFAYAWLELVSHRVFIGRMLAITPQQKVWLYSSCKNVSYSSVNFLRLWQYS